MGIRSYQDLAAWQKSYQLVLEIYGITRAFPTDERFGLTQQLRRAAVSVPSNVAEGWGRSTRSEYARYVEMARGSTYELQTQLKIASGLGYLPTDHGIHEQAAEVERIINGLVKALKDNSNQ